MHSFSMNDASIGEYQYTVNVGRDTLKLSGKRLDVVKTAKLVLEEYFVGDAKRTLHESVEDEYFGTYEDDRSPSEPSPELTSLPRDHPSAVFPSAVKPGGQWVERNGHRLSKSSRITGRCTSHDSTPELEELYRKPQVEDDDDDDDDDSDDNLEGKVYSTAAAVPASSPFLKNGVKPKYVYTRDFLLECAASTYSHSVPKDLPRIIQEVPNILNKKPEFFNPIAYKRGRTTPPISFGNSGTGWNNRSGSWGSQDADDEDAHPS